MTGPILDELDRLDAEIIRLWRERVALIVQLVRLLSGEGGPTYRHAEQVRVTTRTCGNSTPTARNWPTCCLRHVLF